MVLIWISVITTIWVIFCLIVSTYLCILFPFFRSVCKLLSTPFENKVMVKLEAGIKGKKSYLCLNQFCRYFHCQTRKRNFYLNQCYYSLMSDVQVFCSVIKKCWIILFFEILLNLLEYLCFEICLWSQNMWHSSDDFHRTPKNSLKRRPKWYGTNCLVMPSIL